MSVPKPKRVTSDAQFLNTARELERKTRQACLRCPKRYTFYGLQELWQTSRRIHSNVKQANSVNPSNQHEVQIRKDFFIYALAAVQDYVSQIEVMTEDDIFTPAAQENLPELVRLENILIKGTMKSDKARYKDLPEI